MKPKRRLIKNSSQELAEAIIFPITLTPSQQKEASEQLAEARKKNQQVMTEVDKLCLTILQQKFLEEDIGN